MFSWHCNTEYCTHKKTSVRDMGQKLQWTPVKSMECQPRYLFCYWLVCMCCLYNVIYKQIRNRDGDLLQNAKETAQEGNTDAISAMKIIGKIYLQNREVSSQVAVHRVCSLHLKQCTRDVVFIPSGSTCSIYKMSLPISVIKSRFRKGDGNDEKIWMVSIHEKYYARPNLSIFNDIFLAEFASKFFILPNSQHPKSSELSPVYQLQNNLGYVKWRKENKAAVIKYQTFSSEKTLRTIICLYYNSSCHIENQWLYHQV